MTRPGYEDLRIGPGFATRARVVLARCPGLYASRQAFYHDLLRRGLLSLEREVGPSLPAAGVPEAAPRGDRGRSRRHAGSGVEAPQPSRKADSLSRKRPHSPGPQRPPGAKYAPGT